MPITTQEKTENKINDIKSDRDWMEDNEDEFFEKNVAQIEKVRHNVITEFEKKKKKKTLNFLKEHHSENHKQKTK